MASKEAIEETVAAHVAYSSEVRRHAQTDAVAMSRGAKEKGRKQESTTQALLVG